MSEPFFSVIIPTYNRSEVILRAISSVINQNYQNFELIIVDDGSTDNSETLIKSLKDERIIYLKQDNKGVSNARNNGAKIARASWLCFLDSDDEWLIDKLTYQYKYILKHPGCKILHGQEQWIRNGVRVNPKKKHLKAGGDQFLRSLELCIISPSTVCLNKEIFFQLGLFDEDFIVCEDYDLWLKFTSKYSVGFIDKPLIKKYGGHADQLSGQYKAMDFFRVKSIINLLKQSNLTIKQEDQAKQELIKKAAILNKGYKKHNRHKELDQLNQMLNAVDLSQVSRQK